MNLGGPSDFDEFSPEETLEQQVYRLQNELNQLAIEYGVAVQAIKYLLDHCKKNGVDPFPEGPMPLQESLKLIREMKPEELKKRNEEVTKRISPRAKNPDSLKMNDAMVEQEKFVDGFEENPLISLICKALSGNGVISIEEYRQAASGREDNFINTTILIPTNQVIEEKEFMNQKVVEAEREFYAKKSGQQS